MWNLVKIAQAVDPIVPCDGTSCTKEHLFLLVHSLIKYALILSTMAVTVSIMYAAIMYLISAGETEKLGKAKGAIKAAIVGLVIVLVGFILVNTVLSIFGCSNWNVFDIGTVSTVCKGI